MILCRNCMNIHDNENTHQVHEKQVVVGQNGVLVNVIQSTHADCERPAVVDNFFVQLSVLILELEVGKTEFRRFGENLC